MCFSIVFYVFCFLCFLYFVCFNCFDVMMIWFFVEMMVGHKHKLLLVRQRLLHFVRVLDEYLMHRALEETTSSVMQQFHNVSFFCVCLCWNSFFLYCFRLFTCVYQNLGFESAANP